MLFSRSAIHGLFLLSAGFIYLGADAELIQDASQCAALKDAPSSGVLTQIFYLPGRDSMRWLTFCLGSSELPVVSRENYFGDFEPMNTIERFSADNCGTVLAKCCLVYPTPGEIACDYTKYALCSASIAPEDPIQISCSSEIPAVLQSRARKTACRSFQTRLDTTTFHLTLMVVAQRSPPSQMEPCSLDPIKQAHHSFSSEHQTTWCNLPRRASAWLHSLETMDSLQ